jgi:tRNA A-37 threonylcarbamoyl transferase component Bud32
VRFSYNVKQQGILHGDLKAANVMLHGESAIDVVLLLFP